MAVVTIRVDVDLARLTKARNLMPRLMRMACDRIVVAVSAAIQGNVNRRAGMLARSWLPGSKYAERSGETTATGARVTLGSNLRYAAIQERGGTVTASRSKYLTIPTGPALTPAGVARRAGARDWPDLKFIPLSGGRAMLARTKGSGPRRRLIPYYWLVKSVTIPGTWYLKRSVEAVERQAGAIAQAAFDEGLAMIVLRKAGEPD